MAVIVSDSEAIKNFLDEILDLKIRSILHEFGLHSKNDLGAKAESEWLSIEHAKLIVPIKSKQKWKQIRDMAEVNFAKVGKGFIYQRESLVKYVLSQSTLAKSGRNGKGKK